LLERIAHDAGVETPPTLASESLEQLARYGFPGNVRELENLLHRAVALADADVIEPGDLGFEALFGDTVLSDLEPTVPPHSHAAASIPTGAPGAVPPLPSDLVAYLDQVEKEIIERALERHRYNRTAAGASLGLSLRQMRYRMARLGIGVGDGDAP
jgi:two-component system response regulator PilR (NtrC family)